LIIWVLEDWQGYWWRPWGE